MRQCTKCKVSKPITAFNKDKGGKDGLTYYCRECQSEIHRLRQISVRNIPPPKGMKVCGNRECEDGVLPLSSFTKTVSWCKKCVKKYDRKRHLSKQISMIIRRSSFEYKIYDMLSASMCRNNKFEFGEYENVETILGCSIKKFINHIELLFKEGMSWNNRGRTDNSWQMDHIIPLKTSNSREDWIKLNHYTNFQPLWLKEHKQKSKINKHSYKR